MVKADASRNYYADLKVPATASENEIRKAFRTLALQYHPDRNPGREAEFVTKFQDIQAAHEILCDQTQRTKYDAERRKYRNLNIPINTPNTPRTRPPPPPRNAYTTTTPSGSYYRAAPPKPAPQQPRPPPPQHQASYASGADRFTNKHFRPPPTAQRPQDARPKDADARANVFSAWQKMKPQRNEEARAHHNAGVQSKTPEAHAHSQQSNPNGTPFGRSQSTRVPSSSRRGFDPGTPGADEGQAKSAYRNYARAAPTPPSSTEPPHHPPPPKDAQTNEVPYFEANRFRTPYYSSAAGERTSMFDGIGRSASVRNSPTNGHRPGSGMDTGSFSDSGSRQQRNSYGGKSTKPFPNMYADSSDEEDMESEVFRRANKHRDPQPAPPQPQQRPPLPTWNSSSFNPANMPRKTSQSHGTSPNAPNTFKSRSEESINMKFSPSDWHGKFEGSADYFAPNMPKGAATKGRTSPTRGRQGLRSATERAPPPGKMGPPPVSPFPEPPPQQYPGYPIPPPPPGPPPNLNFSRPPEAAPNTAKFRPEEWHNTFKEPTWVFSQQKETSPQRANGTTKRPPKARKGSVTQDKRSKPQETTEVEPKKKYQAFADDADAMDIDESTPPHVTNGHKKKPGSRTAPSSPHRAPPPMASTAPTSGPKSKPPPSALYGLGNIASDDMFKSARDSQDGGIALEELGQTLPYESQASDLHPTKPNTAQKLKFPNLPRPPPVPSKYDQVFVDLYFSQFEQYVREYRKTSRHITAHFTGRDAEIDHDLDHRFAHTRGETSKKIGFASYLAKMKEDEEVMETWKVFQEDHLKALSNCEEIRNRTVKLYSS